MTFATQNLDRNSVVTFFSDPHKRELIERSLDLAITEDVGGRLNLDATTQAVVGPDRRAQAGLLLKDKQVVLAGLPLLEMVLKRFDPTVQVELLKEDGEYLEEPMQVVAKIECQARALLTAERTVLNLIQRMSAIATASYRYSSMARSYGVTILDTRKTTPGMRVFERYAVNIGGATNHRFGLSDGILIKDNHLVVAGGVKNAVNAVRALYPNEQIEVECTRLTEVLEALMCNVDTIMLDNMTPIMVREAVGIIKGAARVEVSGGINLGNLKDYLLTGVDCISVGALTHSVQNVDLSLEVENYS